MKTLKQDWVKIPAMWLSMNSYELRAVLRKMDAKRKRIAGNTPKLRDAWREERETFGRTVQWNELRTQIRASMFLTMKLRRRMLVAEAMRVATEQEEQR